MMVEQQTCGSSLMHRLGEYANHNFDPAFLRTVEEQMVVFLKLPTPNAVIREHLDTIEELEGTIAKLQKENNELKADNNRLRVAGPSAASVVSTSTKKVNPSLP